MIKHNILLLCTHRFISYISQHFAPVYPLFSVPYLCPAVESISKSLHQHSRIVENGEIIPTVRENEPWQTARTTAAFSPTWPSPHDSHIPDKGAIQGIAAKNPNLPRILCPAHEKQLLLSGDVFRYKSITHVTSRPDSPNST